jgi:hypothetical protein
MRFSFMNFVRWPLVIAFLLAGCGNLPTAPTPAATRTVTNEENTGILKVNVLYPTESSKIKMGQTIKVIVQVADESDQPVKDATVTVTFSTPDGEEFDGIPADLGDGDVYRTEAWTIPHHMQEGAWDINVAAKASEGYGEAAGLAMVEYSNSEILYHKYGFWVDEPILLATETSIAAERGNAENGLVRWGGFIPSQHVLPENWVEVQWRKGKFDLSSPEAVRKFLLADVGDIGFTQIREIGEFKKTTFKRWEAWEAPARGLLYYTIIKWTVFYAPEVDKTFAISTTTVHAPKGVDANEILLANFDIDPAIESEGVAPVPLIPLLPKPTLVSPELGTRFTGLVQPIVLKWKPLKDLAEDEYYQVTVDYDYEEANFLVRYATKETQFTLPEALYHLPNCTVFNWRITLMQQTGVDKEDKPVGKALSYESLDWYVRWFYPLDEKAPFDPLCPNALF